MHENPMSDSSMTWPIHENPMSDSSMTWPIHKNPMSDSSMTWPIHENPMSDSSMTWPNIFIITFNKGKIMFISIWFFKYCCKAYKLTKNIQFTLMKTVPIMSY